MSDYDLESLDLPKLYGTPLRIFAWFLQTGLGNRLLMNNLLKSGGVLKLRASSFAEPPTSYPACPHENTQPETNFTGVDGNIEEPPLSANIPYHTVRDYARAYRQGGITPLDVARKFLDAVKDNEQQVPPLRTFVALQEDDVLSQAEASTLRLREGKPLSIFDGVPVTIKDELDQMPYPTFVGTTFLGKSPAVRDAAAVERLRKAGALLLGKANMHEIGINPDGTNMHYGRVCNPWDTGRDTGGSSSGPAAAVAAGFCPLAIGADGGGSIRVPSAQCGVVGLKPTYGRVSERGAAPLCWSVAHIGPIGASVEDVALGYSVIGGSDQEDPHTLHQPPLNLDGWKVPDLTGFKLGVYPDWFRHATADVVSANEQMLAVFQTAGAKIIDINIPQLDLMRIAQAVTILSEMATSMREYQADWHSFSSSTKISLLLGNSMTADDYLRAQRMRTRAIATFERIFGTVDAIISPAVALTAPLIPGAAERSGMSNLSLTTELMRYVFPANLTGHPAISFPAGYDSQGLPVGMQAIGRYWDEQRLFRIARVAEQHLKRKLPAVFYRLF